VNLSDLPLLGFAPVPLVPAAFADEVAMDLQDRLNWIASAAHGAIATSWDRSTLVRDIGGFPHEAETLGLLGEVRDAAAGHVSFSRKELQSWAARIELRPASRHHRQTPLDRLCTDFGLSRLARTILLAVAAPSLRGDLLRLYRIASNDRQRATCDEALLRRLLIDIEAAPTLRGDGDTVNELTREAQFVRDLSLELDCDAPLRRFGLLRMEQGVRPYAALTVDVMLLQMLSDHIVEDRGVVTPRYSDRNLEELSLDPSLRQRALQFICFNPPDHRLRLVVRGRTGSGRRTLLCSLAAKAGRPLGLIDVATIPRDTLDFAAELAQQLKRALFRGMVPCISGLEALFASDDTAAKREVEAALGQHPGPLCIRLPMDVPIPLAPGYVRLDLEPPTELERLQIWQDALERYAFDNVDIGELASRNRIGAGIINRVCEELTIQHRDAAPTLWQPLVETAVSQHLQNRLGNTATHVCRRASWSDIVLPEDIVDSLIELTARVRYRKTVFETWGFDKTITTSRGVTALFSGTPGTGKTMVAGVLARDLGLELYRVDVSRLTSKWLGETEKNLASLFDAAEDGQVMLLFDECDSLFAKRTEVKNSSDRHANMQVNYLLQRLDTFEGIAILTTNFATSIDPAFKRRLTYRVTFPFPDETMREQLWRTMIPSDTPVATDIDYADLARRFRMSGGYIRNAALRAAFFAAEDRTELSQSHIERAVRAEFKAIGKLGDTGTLE
jgi:hypothetical protein